MSASNPSQGLRSLQLEAIKSSQRNLSSAQNVQKPEVPLKDNTADTRTKMFPKTLNRPERGPEEAAKVNHKPLDTNCAPKSSRELPREQINLIKKHITSQPRGLPPTQPTPFSKTQSHPKRRSRKYSGNQTRVSESEYKMYHQRHETNMRKSSGVCGNQISASDPRRYPENQNHSGETSRVCGTSLRGSSGISSKQMNVVSDPQRYLTHKNNKAEASVVRGTEINVSNPKTCPRGYPQSTDHPAEVSGKQIDLVPGKIFTKIYRNSKSHSVLHNDITDPIISPQVALNNEILLKENSSDIESNFEPPETLYFQFYPESPTIPEPIRNLLKSTPRRPVFDSADPVGSLRVRPVEELQSSPFHLRKSCEFCKQAIKEEESTYLQWQCAYFCGMLCLCSYQREILTRNCANCFLEIPESNLGNLVFRLNEILQFCSMPCVEWYKSQGRTCLYCLNKITIPSEYSMSYCHRCYFKQIKSEDRIAIPSTSDVCSICDCSKITIMFESSMCRLFVCREKCLQRYCESKNIVKSFCLICKMFFDRSEEVKVSYKGLMHTVCSEMCQNHLYFSHILTFPCNQCKSIRYDVDLIEKCSRIEPSSFFCSISCYLKNYNCSMDLLELRKDHLPQYLAVVRKDPSQMNVATMCSVQKCDQGTSVSQNVAEKSTQTDMMTPCPIPLPILMPLVLPPSQSSSEKSHDLCEIVGGEVVIFEVAENTDSTSNGTPNHRDLQEDYGCPGKCADSTDDTNNITSTSKPLEAEAATDSESSILNQQDLEADNDYSRKPASDKDDTLDDTNNTMSSECDGMNKFLGFEVATDTGVTSNNQEMTAHTYAKKLVDNIDVNITLNDSGNKLELDVATNTETSKCSADCQDMKAVHEEPVISLYKCDNISLEIEAASDLEISDVLPNQEDKVSTNGSALSIGKSLDTIEAETDIELDVVTNTETNKSSADCQDMRAVHEEPVISLYKCYNISLEIEAAPDLEISDVLPNQEDKVSTNGSAISISKSLDTIEAETDIETNNITARCQDIDRHKDTVNFTAAKCDNPVLVLKDINKNDQIMKPKKDIPDESSFREVISSSVDNDEEKLQDTQIFDEITIKNSKVSASNDLLRNNSTFETIPVGGQQLEIENPNQEQSDTFKKAIHEKGDLDNKLGNSLNVEDITEIVSDQGMSIKGTKRAYKKARRCKANTPVTSTASGSTTETAIDPENTNSKPFEMNCTIDLINSIKDQISESLIQNLVVEINKEDTTNEEKVTKSKTVASINAMLTDIVDDMFGKNMEPISEEKFEKVVNGIQAGFEKMQVYMDINPFKLGLPEDDEAEQTNLDCLEVEAANKKDGIDADSDKTPSVDSDDDVLIIAEEEQDALNETSTRIAFVEPDATNDGEVTKLAPVAAVNAMLGELIDEMFKSDMVSEKRFDSKMFDNVIYAMQSSFQKKLDNCLENAAANNINDNLIPVEDSSEKTEVTLEYEETGRVITLIDTTGLNSLPDDIKIKLKAPGDKKKPPLLPLDPALSIHGLRAWMKTSEEYSSKINYIPQMSMTELAELLSHYVSDVKRPTGKPFAPDTVFYLCLGIQKYLQENRYAINIFFDKSFRSFAQNLNKHLESFVKIFRNKSLIATRVDEEHLWQCNMLGVHSPYILLNTILYHNMKYFRMLNIMDNERKNFILKTVYNEVDPETNMFETSIQYYPDTKSKLFYSMPSNPDKPERCPVKLFEFYTSKLPPLAIKAHKRFYFKPLNSPSEDNYWYSPKGLERSFLELMINRLSTVRQLYSESNEVQEEE